MSELHPEFLTDRDGTPRSVLLPIEEYEALLERLEALEDLQDAREVLARIERGEEEVIPWEVLKAEHGL
jgi:PHD/YefM family antitoxin component YafN of YafNO toxin-antitoxin module